MQDNKDGPVSEEHVYVVPIKMVKNMGDMQIWINSEAYNECLGFICSLNDSIKGKNNEEASKNASPQVDSVCELLDCLDQWIDNIPPIQQPQRFGNQAFRLWYTKLKEEADQLLKQFLPKVLHGSTQEISIYLVEGFGNSTRIDYGTGHELSFLMFICSLFKIGFLEVNDSPAIACKVFVRYLEIVRKLQMIYNMEPAGSHGVWSLDDYQFVPFIWGSSQFIGNLQFDPGCFLRENVINKYSSQYMFLSCIQYINNVKTGPFAEHSNQLWSISAVSTWSKINSGLIKMYKAEVLAKFPLVQHIYFGSLFTLKAFVPPAIQRPKTSFQALNKTPFNTPCAVSSAMASRNDSEYSSASADMKEVPVSSRDVVIADMTSIASARESKDTENLRYRFSSNVTESSASKRNSMSSKQEKRVSIDFAIDGTEAPEDDRKTSENADDTDQKLEK